MAVGDPRLRWRSVRDDLPPDWGEYGRVELKAHDGTVISARMEIDAWFTGNDEVPVSQIWLDDGTRAYLHTFKAWRLTGDD